MLKIKGAKMNEKLKKEIEKKAEKWVKDVFPNDEFKQSGISSALVEFAELGYNKAKEWHYVKDGDLPNTETKNYTYIRRRKRYERQFTDYRVIKCFVLCLNEKGKTTAEVGYFDCNQKCFLDKAEDRVYAWKEIVLPKGGNIPPTPIQVETEQFLIGGKK